jgi:hypothetical protein
MVKRTVSLVARMPSFFFADPARPAILLAHIIHEGS